MQPARTMKQLRPPGLLYRVRAHLGPTRIPRMSICAARTSLRGLPMMLTRQPMPKLEALREVRVHQGAQMRVHVLRAYLRCAPSHSDRVCSPDEAVVDAGPFASAAAGSLAAERAKPGRKTVYPFKCPRCIQRRQRCGPSCQFWAAVQPTATSTASTASAGAPLSHTAESSPSAAESSPSAAPPAAVTATPMPQTTSALSPGVGITALVTRPGAPPVQLTPRHVTFSVGGASSDVDGWDAPPIGGIDMGPQQTQQRKSQRQLDASSRPSASIVRQWLGCE
jgi:hypothetical protein